MSRFVTTALLLLTSTSLADGVGQSTSPSAFQLSLHREACFGFCPVYTVRVDSAGEVRWVGEQHVQRSGPARTAVAAATVQRLQQLVRATHFFSLQSAYLDMPVSDLPYAVIEVWQGQQHKTIRYYQGSQSVPPALVNLAKQVDLALGTAKWIGQKRF